MLMTFLLGMGIMGSFTLAYFIDKDNDSEAALYVVGGGWAIGLLTWGMFF